MRPQKAAASFEERNRRRPGTSAEKGSSSPSSFSSFSSNFGGESKSVGAAEDPTVGTPRSNGQSRRKYVERFGRLARTESGFNDRLATHVRTRDRFLRAKAGIAATRNAMALTGHSTMRNVMEVMMIRRTGVGALAAEDLPEPVLGKKPESEKRHVVCELCARLTVLEMAVQCYSCPVVAHTRCVAERGVAWSGQYANLSSAGRSATRFCHICTADLAARTQARLDLIAEERDGKRRVMAAQVIQNRVRIWANHRAYERRRNLALRVQTAARRLVKRAAFRRQRVLAKRPVNVRVEHADLVFYQGADLPDQPTLFAVLTVLGPRGAELGFVETTTTTTSASSSDARVPLEANFHFEVPEAPLVRRRLGSKPSTKSGGGTTPTTTTTTTTTPNWSPTSADIDPAAGGPTFRAVPNHDTVLPGVPFKNLTLCLTVFLRHRVGHDARYDMNNLVGQGTVHLRPETFEDHGGGSAPAAPSFTVPLQRMRHTLRDQRKDDLRDMNASLHPSMVRAHATVRVDHLNSLFNLTTWLEGPLMDTMRKSADQLANAKGVVRGIQTWWAALTNGVFELYPEANSAKPRVALLAHKVLVDQGLDAGFTVTLPDRRKWTFYARTPREAVRWIYALEYWRVRHQHSHRQAMKIFTQPTRRSAANSTNLNPDKAATFLPRHHPDADAAPTKPLPAGAFPPLHNSLAVSFPSTRDIHNVPKTLGVPKIRAPPPAP